VNNLHLPSSIRVEYGGLYAEERKSSSDCWWYYSGAVAPVCVLLFEFRTFSAPTAILASALLSSFGGFLACLSPRPRSMSLHEWHDHGHRHRRKKRYSPPRRRASLRELGFSAEEAMIQRPPPPAPHRHDRAGHCRDASSGIRIGAGSAMLKPSLSRRRGILSSMVLSLIFTPGSISISSLELPRKNNPCQRTTVPRRSCVGVRFGFPPFTPFSSCFHPAVINLTFTPFAALSGCIGNLIAGTLSEVNFADEFAPCPWVRCNSNRRSRHA